MKNRVLILITIFLSINTTVFSEEKNRIKKPYKLLDEIQLFIPINLKHHSELMKIQSKMDQKNSNIVSNVLDLIVDNNDRLFEIRTILKYEKVFYDQGINNNSVRIIHNEIRNNKFSESIHFFKDSQTTLKKLSYQIKDEFALNVINENIEVMKKIGFWLKKNKIIGEVFSIGTK